MLEVGEADGLDEVLALCESLGEDVFLLAVPEMLNPPMIRASVATPEAAPMPTCLKYANFALPSDKTLP